MTVNHRHGRICEVMFLSSAQQEKVLKLSFILSCNWALWASITIYHSNNWLIFFSPLHAAFSLSFAMETSHILTFKKAAFFCTNARVHTKAKSRFWDVKEIFRNLIKLFHSSPPPFPSSLQDELSVSRLILLNLNRVCARPARWWEGDRGRHDKRREKRFHANASSE